MRTPSKNLLGAYLLGAVLPLTARAAFTPTGGLTIIPLDEILHRITTWILEFGLILCALMIIWGGINYVAAVGDQQRIEKAKKTIHYAVWGLLIIGFSYAIIRTVNRVLLN